MKFFIEYDDNIEQRLLTYIVDEYSFDIDPTVLEIDYYVVINKLDLTVVDNKIFQVSGFCPYSSWIKTNLKIPQFKKGILKVADELKPGFSYGINNEKDWLVYVDIQTGWVCLGNPEAIGNAVEFINNCVAVINNNGEFVSLWLKPQSIPKL